MAKLFANNKKTKVNSDEVINSTANDEFSSGMEGLRKFVSDSEKDLLEGNGSGEKVKMPAQVEKKNLKEGRTAKPGEEDYTAYVIPHRRIKKAARRLVRSNKLLLTALIIVILLLIMFLIAFFQENLGGFTINLNTIQMYRKGISLATNTSFKDASSRLQIPELKRGTNISIEDLDFDALSKIEGDASGMDYIAYGFYIKNGGIDPVDYIYKINFQTKAKGAEKALRIALYDNDEWTIYAAASADGTPEDGTEIFYSDSEVLHKKCKNFEVGEINKYVILMWFEGGDPDCTDSIIGGGVKLNMDFDTGKHEKVTLKDYFKDLPVFRRNK